MAGTGFVSPLFQGPPGGSRQPVLHLLTVGPLLLKLDVQRVVQLAQLLNPEIIVTTSFMLDLQIKNPENVVTTSFRLDLQIKNPENRVTTSFMLDLQIL
jgi:hypothetical protein